MRDGCAAASIPRRAAPGAGATRVPQSGAAAGLRVTATPLHTLPLLEAGPGAPWTPQAALSPALGADRPLGSLGALLAGPMERLLRAELRTASLRPFGSPGAGCISEGRAYDTDAGPVFVKVNYRAQVGTQGARARRRAPPPAPRPAGSGLGVRRSSRARTSRICASRGVQAEEASRCGGLQQTFPSLHSGLLVYLRCTRPPGVPLTAPQESSTHPYPLPLHGHSWLQVDPLLSPGSVPSSPCPTAAPVAHCRHSEVEESSVRVTSGGALSTGLARTQRPLSELSALSGHRPGRCSRGRWPACRPSGALAWCGHRGP